MSEKPSYEELEQRVRELEQAESDHKLAEKALRESEQRFRLAFHTSPDSINLNRASDGMYIDINEGFTNIMGYTREDAIGKTSISLNIWENPADRKRLVDGLAKSGTVENMEARFVGKNGTTREGLMSSRLLRINDEDVIISITRDITETRQAEFVLRESERTLKSIFRAAPIGIGIVSRRVIQDVNERLCEISGFSKDELVGQSAGILYPADEDYEHIEKEQYRQIRDAGAGTVETRFKRKDGGIINVLMSSAPLDLNRISDSVTFTVMDITERKRADEALRESEEKYKSLANNLNVGIYRNSLGPNGKFIEANPAIVEMFGFDNREEFLEIRVSDLYKNPHDRNEYNSKILKEGAVRNEELHLQKKDKTSFIGSVSAVVVKDEKAEVKYYDGIIEDITERKRTEAAIRESEEKYRTVLETNPDPVVLYDIEGEVIYFNPAFTRVFGWSLKECIGKKMDVFVPEEAWRETKMMIEKVLAGITFSGIETRRYNNKGEIIPVSISGAIYKDQNGKPNGSVINLRDISYQKKIEAQLQQAQKMEAIGTLAGGIAHDFNNMLVPLLGYSEMLKADLPADSPAQDHINEIIHVCLRLKALVKQILTFSLQSDQELKPVKLQAIVKEALKLIRSSIPSTIDIQHDIDPDCGVVIADPTQVHQIVMNLATNGYHAMEETGGRLNVTLKQVLIKEDQARLPELLPGKYALLTVADTGVGIEKGVIDKIFDPYFSTKETGKGTGLGLSVVQGIVKSCDGKIYICSKPGIGSDIHVYLPIIERQPDVMPADQSDPIQGGSEKILLVDDEEIIVKTEKQLLDRLGYHVSIRTGSIDALEAFKARPDDFDLIVTDMTMPNMTGVQLAEEIKKIRPDIPIILCTGFSYQINEAKSNALGIQAFLMKPVIFKNIANTIRKVLDDSKKV